MIFASPIFNYSIYVIKIKSYFSLFKTSLIGQDLYVLLCTTNKYIKKYLLYLLLYFYFYETVDVIQYRTKITYILSESKIETFY